jgi:phosphoribosylformylglycinamidine cyclo-ligase
VRKIFSQKELKKYSSELLKPTRIYVKPVLHLLRAKGYELRAAVHGISHITGGAFYDKIARILPRNVDAVIDKDTWPIPKIFPLIQEKGRIEDREMFHTFNLGIGLVLIVAASAQREIMHCLAKFSLPSWVIGQIVKGKKRVRIVE